MTAPVFTDLERRLGQPDQTGSIFSDWLQLCPHPHPSILIHTHNGIKTKLILFQVFLTINPYSVHTLLGLVMQSLLQLVAQSVEVLMEFLSILTILFT
jgi:hypothetical protein